MSKRSQRNKSHVDIVRLLTDRDYFEERAARFRSSFLKRNAASTKIRPVNKRERKVVARSVSQVMENVAPSTSKSAKKLLQKKKKSASRSDSVSSDDNIAELVRQVVSQEVINRKSEKSASTLKPKVLLEKFDRAVDALGKEDTLKILKRYESVVNHDPKAKRVKTKAKAKKTHKALADQCPLCAVNKEPFEVAENPSEELVDLDTDVSCSTGSVVDSDEINTSGNENEEDETTDTHSK